MTVPATGAGSGDVGQCRVVLGGGRWCWEVRGCTVSPVAGSRRTATLASKRSMRLCWSSAGGLSRSSPYWHGTSSSGGCSATSCQQSGSSICVDAGIGAASASSLARHLTRRLTSSGSVFGAAAPLSSPPSPTRIASARRAPPAIDAPDTLGPLPASTSRGSAPVRWKVWSMADTAAETAGGSAVAPTGCERHRWSSSLTACSSRSVGVGARCAITASHAVLR